MGKTINEDYKIVLMSDADFRQLSDFIYESVGIKMHPIKKTLLESRFQRRLRELDIKSFRSYCEYLFTPQGKAKELETFIDTVTTNKTDFFREPVHFEYLTNKALSELIKLRGVTSNKLRVWSAGCSQGDEPYTLAMVLSDYAEACPANNLKFSILATDISVRILKIAKSAVYTEHDIEPVPMIMRKKYLLRSKNRQNPVVKIAPEVRELVTFERKNLMDGDFGFNGLMDIIFCRNVIIYFDRKTQMRLISKFCRNLRVGGYIFIGHSESLSGMDLPLEQVLPTIYRKI